jgi:signal transduction histidine kinase
MAETLDQHRLRRLIEVGRGLVAELDVEAVLQRVLGVARELTGARYAALGILDDSRKGLERFLFVGIDEGTRTAIGDLPRGHGVLGLLIEDPRPLRLRDVGEHPRSYGFPVGHPPMRNFLGVPILIRGEAFGNLYLTEKQDGDFNEADEEATVVLAEWAGIAIQNARLYARSEGRRDELERAVRGLEATTEVARAVGGETDLERMLETISKRARALVEARSLVVLLEEHGELVVASVAGEAGPEVRGRRFPIEGSTAGSVLRSLRPDMITDLATRLRISAADLGVEADSALLIPLSFRGRALGVIVAFDRIRRGPEFDEEDQQLMLAFAASAATAIATAKTVAEERLRRSIEASEQERGRWARELHDETLQGMGALRVLLASALQRGGPEELRQAVTDSVGQLSTEIESLRGLISELRPAALEALGLAAAIEGLAERAAMVQGLRVDIDVHLAEHADARSTEVENAVYRTVQEALHNIAKHASAEEVAVRVTEDEGAIEVIVRDDGVGFDPHADHDGFGLAGMRERVEMAGGRLEISSAPGDGAVIRTVVPVAGEGGDTQAAVGAAG